MGVASNSDPKRADSVFFCSSTPKKYRTRYDYGSTSYPRDIRQWLESFSNDAHTPGPIRMINVREPSKFIFHFEARCKWETGGVKPNASFPATYNSWQHSWHGKNISSLYWDGRVVGHTPTEWTHFLSMSPGSKPPLFYGYKFMNIAR